MVGLTIYHLDNESLCQVRKLKVRNHDSWSSLSTGLLKRLKQLKLSPTKLLREIELETES